MVLRDKKQPGAASGIAERWPPAPGAGFSALVSERDDHIARSLPVGRQEITMISSQKTLLGASQAPAWQASGESRAGPVLRAGLREGSAPRGAPAEGALSRGGKSPWRPVTVPLPGA